LFSGVATGFDIIVQETKKNLATIITTIANHIYWTTIIAIPIMKTQQQIQ
jgi:hypothetical protein